MNIAVLTDQISRTSRDFRIEVVRTDEQLREVFQLRHQVYCVERGYEAGEDGEETDEFDARSRHVLLRHTADGEVVGTVRLISPAEPGSRDEFPMQRLCPPELLAHLPLATAGEISRFAISKQRRMGCAEVMLLRLALMRGIAQLSTEMGLTHWLAVMERSLMRLQQRNAIHFDAIGPLVSYHGIRQPAVGVIKPVLEGIRREQFPTWNFLTDGGRWLSAREAVRVAA
jgi:N-acyl-L-homoserine lactone synthetase